MPHDSVARLLLNERKKKDAHRCDSGTMIGAMTEEVFRARAQSSDDLHVQLGQLIRWSFLGQFR